VHRAALGIAKLGAVRIGEPKSIYSRTRLTRAARRRKRHISSCIACKLVSARDPGSDPTTITNDYICRFPLPTECSCSPRGVVGGKFNGVYPPSRCSLSCQSHTARWAGQRIKRSSLSYAVKRRGAGANGASAEDPLTGSSSPRIRLYRPCLDGRPDPSISCIRVTIGCPALTYSAEVEL